MRETKIEETEKLDASNRLVGQKCGGSCSRRFKTGDRVGHDGQVFRHHDCANPQK